MIAGLTRVVNGLAWSLTLAAPALIGAVLYYASGGR